MDKLLPKYLFVALTLFLTLPACISDMDIDVQTPEREVVVTCLFSPQGNWKLTLAKTKTLQENKDTYINNALVKITTETGEEVTLNYSGERGIYSSNTRPEVDKTYRLNIHIPGHREITAESRIPNIVNATVPDFDIKWIKYLYPNNLMDYDVFPLQVNFGETVQDARFLFRSYYFDPNEGYKRYMLTMDSLEKLKKAGLPENAYLELAELADQWVVNQSIFDHILFKLVFFEDFDLKQRLSYLLYQDLKQKTVSAREYEAFGRSVCFGNDYWLNNVSYDVMTTIGEAENVTHAKLLYANANLKYSMDKNQKRDEEFWLEVIQGSKEYVDYYHSYI